MSLSARGLWRRKDVGVRGRCAAATLRLASVCMAVINRVTHRCVAISSHVFYSSAERLLAADRLWFQSVRRGVPTGKQYTSFFSHSATGSMMKKLLVDVDCGVDDAQAIMLALAAPNVELLGVTCVHGNTTVENVCKNTLRVLQACNKLEVPVFKGAAKPILGNSISGGHFHGQDGLGDAPDPNAPTRGNTTVCGEFNFAADPEAAYIVLNDYQCPTYLACWEFTCYSKLSWEFCDAWLAQDTDKARFMERIFRHSIEVSETERFQNECVAGTGFISCDSYAMAAAVDDSFIMESDHYPVSVELAGTHTRGMMIVDTVGFLKKSRKVFIMKKVDMKKFEQMMMAALK